MPGRKYNTNAYRYGFNGKEKDDEIANVEGAYDDFGARMYDSRLGRWMKTDPLGKMYPPFSPYNFALNSPIQLQDADGRLVIYANGLRFGASVKRAFIRFINPLIPKLGDDISFKNEEGVYKNYSQISGDKNDEETGGYWKSVKMEISSYFDDNNEVYVDGTNAWWSSADKREEEGARAAINIDEMIKKGKIILAPGETIKLAGHSQGAAYAAGMAKKLIELGYPVEEIIYLAPHQPKGIDHPVGVPAYQLSRKSDAIASRGIIPKTISRSEFGIISGPLIMPKIIPDLKHFFGSDGFRGHSISTYKDYIPNQDAIDEERKQNDNWDTRPSTPDESERKSGEG